MIVEFVGFFLAYAECAGPALAIGAGVNTLADLGEKAYNYVSARQMAVVVHKVWADSPKLRSLFKNPDELAKMMSAETDYTVQEVNFSPMKCHMLQVEHRSFWVAWSDEELGCVVRNDRIISSGTADDENFAELHELFRLGEARFIVLMEAELVPKSTQED